MDGKTLYRVQCKTTSSTLQTAGIKPYKYLDPGMGSSGPRGLASTSRTPRGQNFVALASKTSGIGLEHIPAWTKRVSDDDMIENNKRTAIWQTAAENMNTSSKSKLASY